MSEISLQSALLTLLSGLVVAYALVLAVRKMGRIHPELRIGLPIAIGFFARLLTVLAIDGTGLSAALRGGDETTFLQNAHGLSLLGKASEPWLDVILNDLHIAVFAVQDWLLDSPPTAMRMVQIGISMAGLLLLVAAVHELAGPRAGRLAAWVLMIEPAGIFFDSAVHKEPLMLLGSGLAVYGGTRIWRKLDTAGIAIAALGGAIAVMTRGYAGWFLVSGMVLLILHTSLRKIDHPLRSMPLIYAVIVVGFLATPTLLQLSSPESLKRLQASQNANTDPSALANSSGSNSNNLALENVDFSTREKIVTNLPTRIADVVLKPYPWQLANASQVLGSFGSMAAMAALFLLFRYAWGARGRLLTLTAPVVYPLTFLLIAYSLSAGNAGTSFRYRTHIVTLSLVMLIVLRADYLARHARYPGGAREQVAPRRAPVAGRIA
ncbi:MAG: glycosyltransferase family 39 protein [Solirubrobacterales bacterium]|nr:glycosyltransferase family 39 protein [Solirubrobacterales bacterium]